MKDIKGVFYYLTLNTRFTFIVFWIILTAIFGLSIVLSLITNTDDIFFQPYMPVYIFSMVMGMWIVNNSLPYLLKMGVTRKLMIGVIWAYFLLFSIISTLLAHVFAGISYLLGKNLTGGQITLSNGETEFMFNFVHIGQFMTDDSWLNRMMIDVIICFTLLVAMFIIGLIFHQYGLIGGFSFVGILFASLLAIIATDQISAILTYVFEHYSITLYLQLFLCTVIAYILSFIVLRRYIFK